MSEKFYPYSIRFLRGQNTIKALGWLVTQDIENGILFSTGPTNRIKIYDNILPGKTRESLITQFAHLLNSSTLFQSYNMSKLKKIYIFSIYDNTINTFHIFYFFPRLPFYHVIRLPSMCVRTRHPRKNKYVMERGDGEFSFDRQT